MVAHELDGAGYQAFFEEAAQGMLLVSDQGSFWTPTARLARSWATGEKSCVARGGTVFYKATGWDATTGRSPA